MEKIIPNPTDEELNIVGEFLGLEINATSFTVKSQLYFAKDWPISYQVNRTIYPLSYIQKFFKENSEVPSEDFFPRIKDFLLLEPEVYVGGKLKGS